MTLDSNSDGICRHSGRFKAGNSTDRIWRDAHACLSAIWRHGDALHKATGAHRHERYHHLLCRRPAIANGVDTGPLRLAVADRDPVSLAERYGDPVHGVDYEPSSGISRRWGECRRAGILLSTDMDRGDWLRILFRDSRIIHMDWCSDDFRQHNLCRLS